MQFRYRKKGEEEANSSSSNSNKSRVERIVGDYMSGHKDGNTAISSRVATADMKLKSAEVNTAISEASKILSELDSYKNKEQLDSAYTSLNSIYDRLYKEKQNVMKGGYDEGYTNAITSATKSIDSALYNWDSITNKSKNEEAYNQQAKRDAFYKQTGNIGYEDVQKKMASFSPESDEYQWLKEYGLNVGYNNLKDYDEELGALKSSRYANPVNASINKNTTNSSEIARNANAYQNNIAPADSYEQRLQAKRNQYRLDNILEDTNYAVDSAKSNYAQDSQYDSSINDETYKIINGASNGKSGSNFASYMPFKQLKEDTKLEHYAQMTDEERAYYNYLYKQDKKQADEFLKKIDVSLGYRATQKMDEQLSDMASDSALASLGLTALARPASILGGIMATADAVVNKIVGNEYNPYNASNYLSNFASGATQAVSNAIADSNNFNIGNVNVPAFLYQTGTSVLDSAIGVATMGQGYTALMGLTASQNKARELKEQGATEGQIISGAMSAGVIEMLTEEFSVESLIHMKSTTGLKTWLSNTLKQAGIEASEETASEVLNTIMDNNILGANSESSKMYDYYKSLGYTDGQATDAVWGKFLGNVLESAIGGALSGGALGGGGSAINYAKLNSIGNKVNNGTLGNALETYMPESEALKEVKQLNNDSKNNAKRGDAFNKAFEEAQKLAETGETETDKQAGINAMNAIINALKAQTSAKAKDTAKNESVTEMAETKAESFNNNKTEDIKDDKAYTDEFNRIWSDGIKGVELNTDNLKTISNETAQTIYNDAVSYIESEANTVTGNVKMDTAYLNNLNKAETQAFKNNYNGEDMETYKIAFKNAWIQGMQGTGSEKLILESKDISPRQALNIYTEASKFQTMACQSALNDAIANSKKEGNNSTIDDSVIDFESTGEQGKVQWNTLTTDQKLGVLITRELAKAFGVNTRYVSSKDNAEHRSINGQFDKASNSILLDVYAETGGKFKGGEMVAFSHEMTHWMKNKSPQLYSSVQEQVLNAYTTAGNTTAIADEMRRLKSKFSDRYADVSEDVLREDAIDELVARGCEDMLSNSSYAREILTNLSQEEANTFVKKIKEVFSNVIRAINSILGRIESGSKEAKMLASQRDTFNEVLKTWDAMLRESVAVNNKIDATQINNTLEKIGLEYDAETESVYSQNSLKSWENSEYVKNREESIEAIMKVTKESREKVTAYIDSINNVAKLIADDKARLDYEADENNSSFVSNAEYGGSIDFSLICAKRRLYTGTIQKIQEQLNNTALEPRDYLEIRAMMLGENLQVTCGCCYVEGSRMKLGKMMKQFQKRYAVDNPSYIPNMYELTTPDGIRELRRNHPEAYKARDKFLNNRGVLHEGESNLFSSQGKPKDYTERTDYRGEILKAFKGKKDSVEAKNAFGGLRLQSFSDFELVNLIDCMQVIFDMYQVKLAGQAYTKVYDFADSLGQTGLKINLSLMAQGVDEDGHLILDEVNGMKRSEAEELRNKYSDNVGTIIVVFDEAQLKSALKDDFIDYIIPFHKSQWSKSDYGVLGLPSTTLDFTRRQNERYRSEKGTLKKTKTNIMPKEYWDYSKTGKQNAETYINKCNERNITPKFNFLLEGEEGNYRLPESGEADGYWKLLIDFKMYNNDGIGAPQNPVKPIFNDDLLQKKLDEYAGGHESFPVADDIVDKFVEKYKSEHPKKSQPVEYQYSEKNENKQDTKIFDEYENDDILKFIESFRDGKLSKKSFVKISQTVPLKLINDIYKILNINVTGYSNELSANDYSHIEKRHGINGEADESLKDAHNTAKIQYALENYDKIEKGKYSKEYHSDTVVLNCKLGDKFYYVVEAVPDNNKKRLHVISAYISGKDILKNNTLSDELVSNDPERYVQDEHQPSVLSKDSIDQLNTNVNNTQDSEKDIENTYDFTGDSESILVENDIIRNDLESLVKKLRLQNMVPSDTTLESMGQMLRHKWGGTYSSKQIAESLKGFFTEVSQDKPLDFDSLMLKAEVIAKQIADGRIEKTSNDYAKMVLNEFRTTRFSLSEAQKETMSNVYGADWRKKSFGKFRIVNEGTPLSLVYDELSDKYPELLSKDVNEADMIYYLLDAYDNLKDTSEIITRYNDAETVRGITQDIYDLIWKAPYKVSNVQSVQNQINKLKAEHKQAMQKLSDEKDARAEKNINDVKERYRKTVANVRADRDFKVKQAKYDAQWKMAEYKDEQLKKNLINKITNKSMELKDWLETNSKDKHIPESLKAPLSVFLDTIDFTSGKNSKKDERLIQSLENVKRVAEELRKNQTSLDATTDDVFGAYLDLPNELIEQMDALITVMKAYASSGSASIVLNQMTSAELDALNDTITALKTSISKINKRLGSRRKENLMPTIEQSTREMSELGQMESGYTDKIKGFLGWSNATPYTAFKHLGEGAMSIFEEVQDGWDKFAMNIKEILDYTKKVYKDNNVKVKELEKEIHSFDLKEGHIELSTSQLMSLYCLNKREQARQHILGGGIVAGKIEGKKGKTGEFENIGVTQAEVDVMLSKLTTTQKKVADALQAFMTGRASEWGNEVSMERFGIKQFTEENYFPIKSWNMDNLNDNGVPAEGNDLFRLLNMGFTKALNKKANNPLMLESIFDVFTAHTTDMAKYNSLALPVLDAFRWYSYKEKIETSKDAETGKNKYKVKQVKLEMSKAFGKDANNYFLTFLKDLNGTQEGGREEGFFKKMMSNYKISAVAGNIRVALLQPTAYVRAMAVLDPKYLAKGALDVTKLKANIAEAQNYSGIAQWKALGFYDTSVSRSVREMIKNGESTIDKARDASLRLAELGDKITWGAIWNSCKLEVSDKTKLRYGTDEYWQAVSDRFRDVIYRTQVVDSTMTRTQIMRSKSALVQMATAFMSEPSISYNMLACEFFDWNNDLRKTKNFNATFAKHGKRMARVFGAYVATASVASIVEGLVDAIRKGFDDDDEDENVIIDEILSNFWNDLDIIQKIPIVKDIVSGFKGYTPTRMDEQYITSLITAKNKWAKVFGGDSSQMYQAIYKSLVSLSQVTGLPISNPVRDVVAMWNATIAKMYGSLEIK